MSAPFAVITVDCPLHMVALLAAANTKMLFTLINVVSAEEHPKGLVTVNI